MEGLTLHLTATHCISLQRTATHCNTGRPAHAAASPATCISKMYATHCNSLQALHLPATHCNTLQLIATHCNTLQQRKTCACCRVIRNVRFKNVRNSLILTTPHYISLQFTTSHCNSLHLTATHCNSLQLTATHCNKEDLRMLSQYAFQKGTHHTATHYNALQLTASHCESLQLTATHCNTLQHTATKEDLRMLPRHPQRAFRKFIHIIDHACVFGFFEFVRALHAGDTHDAFIFMELCSLICET